MTGVILETCDYVSDGKPPDGRSARRGCTGYKSAWRGRHGASVIVPTGPMKNQETTDNKSRHKPSNTEEPTSKKPNRGGSRQASVARDQNGDPIGAAIWLNADELAALGIDPDRTDAVDIQVTDGDLELTPAHGGDDGR